MRHLFDLDRACRARASLAGGALIGPGAVFGSAAAVSWGIGDFCGGLLGRWSSVLTSLLVAQTLPTLPLLLILAASGETQPSAEHMIWAILAGASGVTGLAFFYFALARGTMGVVAPLAAVIGLGIPVLVGFAGGESLSSLRLLGIACALVAVVLISVPTRPADNAAGRKLRTDISDLPLVGLAGLGFAGFFIFMDRATEAGATWWPLATVRVVGTVLVVVAAIAIIATRTAPTLRARASDALGVRRLRESGRTWSVLAPLLVITATADLGGNVFFVMANRTDALAIAVALSSLYPVVTTLLAAIFLRERLSRLQIVGVILATASVPLLR
ncbi:MAG: EamA family transporter [Chloroflexota bacterium]